MQSRRLGLSGLALALALCGCDGGEKTTTIEGEFKPADTSQLDQMKAQMINQVKKSGGKVKVSPPGGANDKVK